MTTEDILAAAVAVAIVKARRAGEHQDPTTREDKLGLVTRHSINTLAELGLTSDSLPDYPDVERQIIRRGGWTASAQPIVLTFVMQCLQCADAEIKVYDTVAGRKKAIQVHREKTGHTVISRFEPPSIM